MSLLEQYKNNPDILEPIKLILKHTPSTEQEIEEAINMICPIADQSGSTLKEILWAIYFSYTRYVRATSEIASKSFQTILNRLSK